MSQPEQSPSTNGAPAAGEGPVVPQVEHAEVVTAGQRPTGDQTEAVEQPAKVMRIGSMIKLLLEEVRQTDTELDEASRDRLREIYETSVSELSSALSPDLRDELGRLAHPFAGTTAPSERRAAHRQGPAGRVARGPVPRHPGHAVRPADGGPPAARRDAPPAAPGRACPGHRLRGPAGHLSVGNCSSRS